MGVPICDTPVGAGIEDVVGWITRAVEQCSHKAEGDDKECECHAFIRRVVTSYVRTIRSLQKKRHNKKLTPAEVLDEIGLQCDYERDLIVANERVDELERRVRHLTETLRIQAADELKEEKT